MYAGWLNASVTRAPFGKFSQSEATTVDVRSWPPASSTVAAVSALKVDPGSNWSVKMWLYWFSVSDARRIVRVDRGELGGGAHLAGLDLDDGDRAALGAHVLHLLADQLLQVPLQVAVDRQLKSSAVDSRLLHLGARDHDTVLALLEREGSVGGEQAVVLALLDAGERVAVDSHEADEVAGDRAVGVGPRGVRVEREVRCPDVDKSPVLLGRQAPLQIRELRVGVLGERVGDDLPHVVGGLARHGADLGGDVLPRHDDALAVVVFAGDRPDVLRVQDTVVEQDAARQRLPGFIDDLTPRAIQRPRGAERDLHGVGDVIVGVHDLDVHQPHDEPGEHGEHHGEGDHRAAARAPRASRGHVLSVCSGWADRR